MSYPKPASIQTADICRDGGTFVLVYFDYSGAQHEVELRVRKDENYEVIGYWPPSLKSYETGELSLLDWDEAASLGERLAPLIGNAVEWGGPDRARQIVEVLSLRGHRPTNS